MQHRAGLQWVLPAAHMGSVRCDRHQAHARRGVKLHASLELGGEEEDGFPDVLPADWGWRGIGGFQSFSEFVADVFRCSCGAVPHSCELCWGGGAAVSLVSKS